MSHDFDVAIVGCGPVGATLAALLGQRGLRVVAIERGREIYPLPRAVVIDGEIVRMYQMLGLADSIAQASSPMRHFRYENEKHEVLLDWDLPADESGDQGWASAHMFHQPDVERLLRDKMAEFPAVELWDGHEVVGLEQTDDEVALTVRDLSRGATKRLTAAYTVGCDGGSSMVRKHMGVKFESLGPAQDWVVVDGVGPHKIDLEEGQMIGYCWPERPHLFLPTGNDRLRWEFLVRPEDDREEIESDAGIRRLIERFVDPDEVVLERRAVYTFLSLLAEHWRDRRIFLAGDAAHMQPPLRAQGLCSGIRDAVNLSWKLEAVFKGRAEEDLLDTYESERRAHSKAWIKLATDLAKIINTTDPQIAAARDAAMLAHPPEPVDDIPLLGPGLHGDEGPPAGKLSQQLVLEDGTRMDDVTGDRFLVAMAEGIEDGLPADSRELIADADQFHVLEPGSAQANEYLARHGDVKAIVVRPDRYILGVAADAEGLAAVLAKWSAKLCATGVKS